MSGSACKVERGVGAQLVWLSVPVAFTILLPAPCSPSIFTEEGEAGEVGSFGQSENAVAFACKPVGHGDETLAVCNRQRPRLAWCDKDLRPAFKKGIK